ncbi:UDP-glucosyltransferase 2-like [Penaeus japonicus]|uniref:UDP-glucosyltransferase 2-like n=1 Tax=Penaeus japonicus TaxID=27405 RepID=UPI001C70D007|nr:UDP-glucosyltransferase 2-like [Penaeus japonicus]XP_042856817.1 UDP-glucosyltransferase 2-like [Penaeus japonicus]
MAAFRTSHKSSSAALLLVLLLTFQGLAKGYQVLVLGPVGSRSLYHLCRALSEALSHAGHSVTIVSSFEPSQSIPNVTEVHTGSNVVQQVNMFEGSRTPMRVFRWAMRVSEDIARAMWTNDEVKALWRRRADFDAIVIIGYANEVAYPFLLDFEGLHVNLCTPGVEYLQVAQLGNRLPLSVVPAIFLPFDENMSFLERLVNPWAQVLSHFVYASTVLPSAQRIVEEFFPGMPPLEKLYQGSHLTLINGHFAMDTPVPLLPNQVEIGTINAREAKPLPEDLAKFIDDSGDAGVIYFSLGSIGQSTDMPREYKDIFLEAFRQLPQRVVWKYEGDDLQLPTNVITRSWLPQQDILGHANTRLFISHCGNLGTQEAKYHAVPILAVPLTFDQHRNAARLAKKGCGTVLNWENLSVTNVIEKVDVLLRDGSYRKCMRAISAALHDQKESPGERAVWWIEYMIRHRNSTLLEYPGKRLHYLQYSMVDVWAAWAAVFTLWALLGWTCVRVTCRGRLKQKSE